MMGVPIKCEGCGIIFRVILCRKYRAKYCTRKCYVKHHLIWNKGLTMKTDSRIKSNIGNNKGRIPWNKGIPRSEETKRKVSETKKRLYKEGKIKLSPYVFKKGHISHNRNKTKENYLPLRNTSEKMKNRKFSKEHKEKIKKTHWSKKEELRKIVLAKMHTDEANSKRVSSVIKTLKENKENKRPNSWENKICELCIKHSLPFIYTGDGTFWIKGVNKINKNPDFIYKDKKVAIEVYYDYFKKKNYGTIENYKKHCEKIYNSKGWEVIFIDGNDINNENWENKCLDKINEVIKNE